jgi:hypothetical protein
MYDTYESERPRRQIDFDHFLVLMRILIDHQVDAHEIMFQSNESAISDCCFLTDILPPKLALYGDNTHDVK